MNLMDPAGWHVYSGAWKHEVFEEQPTFRNTGETLYTRAVTKQNFQAPKRLRGWFMWMGSKYPTPAPSYAGIHFHVGHQSNQYNYVISLRHDDLAMIQREHDGKYKALAAPEPFALAGWTRYQFECLWDSSSLELRVNDKLVIREDPNAHVAAGPRYMTGQVGFRLDRQHIRLGSLSIE